MLLFPFTSETPTHDETSKYDGEDSGSSITRSQLMMPLPPAVNESSESEVIDSSQDPEPQMPTGNLNCYKYRASIQKFTQTSFFTARKRAMSQVLDESEDEVIDSSQETEPKMPTGN